MIEPTPKAAPASGGTSAGALLRAARERRGMHVVALAATVKVTPSKIEALEADRYDLLPDVTFARALARTVCRVLGIDPAPVVALLPQAPNIGPGLEQVHNGLNTPLRARAGAEARDWRRALLRPALWLPLMLLAAALGVYLLPQDWTARARLDAIGSDPTPGTVTETTVPSVAGAASSPVVVETTAPALPPEAPASAPPAAQAAPDAAVALVQLHAGADAWIEVVDASRAPLVQRTVRAGETLDLDGTPPLRAKIGNASTVRLTFRGQPVDLTAYTRDNVARLELK